MFKYAIAAALLLTATPASAQIMISSGRQALIKEAAKSICRTVVESNSKASDVYEREVAYLRLNTDESIYMLSLCVLYAQGRLDELKAR